MMCGVEADIPAPGTQAQRPQGLSGRLIGDGRLLGDERLAQAAGAGSERAFTTLFQRYHQQLYRYCRGLTGSDQDAQDALQTAFTKALIALREGRRNAPLRPWLYRIAHNESISLIRGRSTAVADLPLELASAQGVSDSAEERERMAMLITDLRELPEQQRGALVMRELSGLSHEEIAAALQVSAGAAKQSILEARRSLLEFAEGRAMTCEEIQRIISDDDRRSLRSRRVRAHLRDCGVCAVFAEAIPRRRADMMALWPVLPAATSAGLLAKITAGAGSGHGGGGAGLVAGTAAKGIGTTISIKAATAAGVAVIATAGAGVGAVAVIHHGASPHTSLTRTVASGGASGAGHGPNATRAVSIAPRGGSKHRVATGTGPGAAGGRATGHGSHAGGNAGRGSAATNHGSAGGSNGHGGGPSTAPSNHGHSTTSSASTTHHGSSHTTRGKPVSLRPTVHKRAKKRVVHHRVKPRHHRMKKVVKRTTHTVTSATKTRTTATTKTTASSTHTKTTATGKAGTTTSATTSTTSAETITTATVTTTDATSGPVNGGQGSAGGPAAQSAGSAAGNKISK